MQSAATAREASVLKEARYLAGSLISSRPAVSSKAIHCQELALSITSSSVGGGTGAGLSTGASVGGALVGKTGCAGGGGTQAARIIRAITSPANNIERFLENIPSPLGFRHLCENDLMHKEFLF